MIEVTASSSGQTVRLRSGERIRCTLPENPTTGYRWELQPHPGFSLDSDNYQSSQSRPGASGLRTFELTALSSGTHDLRLVNRRSWDQASVTQTFQLTVVIE